MHRFSARTPVPLRPQYTLARPAKISGFGFWSGADVTIELKPADPNTGLVFVRRDLGSSARIPALVQHRVETPRRTSLRAGQANVEMVEHVLAALHGLEIDNCEIWTDRPEMPGGDGSSRAIVAAIDAVGRVPQIELRSRLVVRETTRVGDADCWIEASPHNQPGLSTLYKLDYGRDNAIGKQAFEVGKLTPEAFRKELADARTFVLKDEAEWLHKRGLGLRVSNHDILVFGPEGPLDNTLRWDDECARHKTLDVVGDLALCGFEIHGRIVGHRSGHRLTCELVRNLLSECELQTSRRRSA